ncbi:MAG TPA: hypothetical protein VFP97_09505 [Chitinophagaceae bacterium]|nr:hypothetical protein [Chitinophagaceae bacterium]
MGKLILYILILTLPTVVAAQDYDSWAIYHNRKEVSKFNNKKETNDERRVTLLNRILEGPGFFIVEYTPAAEQSDWIRTIGFFDTSGKSIREYSNTLFLKIHNSEIAGIMENQQKVRVYSWAVPKDPAVAATVRVRRLLLCTLYKR